MAIKFNRKFAPQEGLTKDLQKPFRDEICLNGFWQFAPELLDHKQRTLEDCPEVIPEHLEWSDTRLKVPSPWNVNAFTDGEGGDFQNYPSYPKVWENVKSAWLKKTILIPENWKNNRVKLHFEAVAGCSRVFINGHKVKDNFDAFLPFAVDITGYVKPGEEAQVIVWVAHGSLFNQPGKYGYREYVSGSFWGTHIAGIWQDVYLQKVAQVYIEDVFVKPLVRQKRIDLEVTVTNETDEFKSMVLEGSIKKWINGNMEGVLEVAEVKWSLGETLLEIKGKRIEIQPHQTMTQDISVEVSGELPLWQPDQPELLGLLLDLVGIDRHFVRFGWREFRIQGKQLYLNGKQIQIKGDSWHFMGIPQMTRRYAYGWYQMLKDIGGNGVRLHAQVYPRFYLEMADEMGICVLDESAIWFSDAGPRVDSEGYWGAARDHVKRMVLRDRNYPSVFGWSVCNETLEVTQRVYHASYKYVRRNVNEINGWTQIAKDLDGTRDWISGDGELFPNTNLPTRIIHYADEAIFQWLFHLLPKPWGVGETGRSYYGSPAQVAKFNGDRAYESQLGRMEGLAAEAFDLIRRQRHFKAAYTCVFNLIWYGLKPLALGLVDKRQAPKYENGIFFGDFEEGRPGCQPERLGPYCTTINPGYVPNAPLYETWPLIEAVRDAYSEDYKEKVNLWKKKTDTTVRVEKANDLNSVVLISDDQNHILKNQLEHVGIVFEVFQAHVKQLIIVDGLHLPTIDSVEDLKSAMASGSTLFVWNADYRATEFLMALTGEEVLVCHKHGSSYIISEGHPLLNNTSNATWYFSEKAEDYTSKFTIGGQWAETSKTLLKVSPVDWRRWNYQSESTKTAKVYRSEQENQGPDGVIVQRAYGKGELFVSTVDLFSIIGVEETLIRPMMKNLGVRDLKSARKVQSALDRSKRLVCLKGPSNEKVKANIFGDFNSKYYLDGAELSFWLYSPRSLTDLLIEPGIPRLDLEMKGSVACAISINGIHVDRFTYEGNNKIQVLTGVPFEKGWNKISFKIAKGELLGTKIKFKFRSNKRKFLKEIKSVTERLYRG